MRPPHPPMVATPDHRDLIREGDGYLREGELDLALKSYRKAARIHPSCPAEKKAALALGMMGRYMEAIGSFDRAAEIDPQDPQPWIFRGFLFWRLLRWEEALASFDRAIALRPEEGYPRYCRDLTAEEISKRRGRRRGGG